MSNEEEHERPIHLYRFTYWEEPTSPPSVEWVFGGSDRDMEKHGSMYKDMAFHYEYRRATPDESAAYDEGFTEASALADATSRMQNWNGVTFRIDRFTEDNLETTKIFECAKCGKHKEFEAEAATIGEYYICTPSPRERNESLWHVCRECAIQ